ncbi:MAG: carbohydrate ABC transporter permease [Candidatus Dormibacteraceae bacterium]
MADQVAVRPSTDSGGVESLTWRERLDDFRQRYLWSYLFIAPMIILIAVFLFFPLVDALIISFQKIGIARDEVTQWVGFANFVSTVTDSVWQRALLNTFIFTVVTVGADLVLSLLLAWLIFPLSSSAQSFFKACYYLPVHIGGIMVALVWYWMFDPTEGVLNYLIGLAGVPHQNWIADPNFALQSLMLIPILSGHGAGVILYLAAMGGIPKTLYEAADIDAASAWSKLKNVTWPLLKPTTLYVVITGTIGSFQVFDLIYVLTRGGPDFATVTLVYLVYQVAFEQYSFGLASAQAFVLAAIIVVLSLAQFRFLASDVEY